MLSPPLWQIELEGSELARIEQDGANLVIVLAAARVPGDRHQRGLEQTGGHLQGVRLHLLEARCTGPVSALVGRLDEASWACEASPPGLRAPVAVPSSGATPVHLSLRTALGDTLSVQAQAWRIEWMPGGRFTPSLAC